ncbi:MazG nucleotide pyrophosphohydrolase domain-containing protein [Spongorhabdus nitratireducens]
MDLKALQDHIRQHDFTPEQAQGYFLKLVEETGELAQALRHNKSGQPGMEDLKGSVAEELYDILYYVCALANIHGVDLELTHQLKEQLNKTKYNR